MELILAGTPVSALELERLGVVNRVCTADEDVVQVALETAGRIALFSAPAVALAKQAVKTGEFDRGLRPPPQGFQAIKSVLTGEPGG